MVIDKLSEIQQIKMKQLQRKQSKCKNNSVVVKKLSKFLKNYLKKMNADHCRLNSEEIVTFKEYSFILTFSDNIHLLFSFSISVLYSNSNSNQHTLNLKLVKMQQQRYKYMKDQRKNKQQSTKILTNENII